MEKRGFFREPTIRVKGEQKKITSVRFNPDRRKIDVHYKGGMIVDPPVGDFIQGSEALLLVKIAPQIGGAIVKKLLSGE